MFVIALIGPPNVGKSTLYNRIIGKRQAIVANIPGVTRDHQISTTSFQDKRFIIMDTAGISSTKLDDDLPVENQIDLARDDADAVVLVTDARMQPSTEVEHIALELRKTGKPIMLLINKADGTNHEQTKADHAHLGFANVHVCSAINGHGVHAALTTLSAWIPKDQSPTRTEADLTIALLGRPNVGKSTLTNQLMGKERMMTSPIAGTTRDAIMNRFTWRGRQVDLVDTAGLRRSSRIKAIIEKLACIKTLQAIEHADVVVLMFDACAPLSDQDRRLAQRAIDSGCPIVIALNHVDNIPKNQRETVSQYFTEELRFVDNLPILMISAKTSLGCDAILPKCFAVQEKTKQNIRTNQLTQHLHAATTAHPPPLINGRRIKLRMAHLGGRRPMSIIVHGKQAHKCPPSYQRYLLRYFERVLDCQGSIIHLKLKTNTNPYVTNPS